MHFVRPVAYAAPEDVAESDWNKRESSVVQKEREEDTELVQEKAGNFKNVLTSWKHWPIQIRLS